MAESAKPHVLDALDDSLGRWAAERKVPAYRVAQVRKWLFQKREAEKGVRHIRGVRDVRNHIEITVAAVERDIRHRIAQALHRNANLDAHQITVTVLGNKAILTGEVGTWLQRESAERAAADAPGIAHVDNRITVHVRLGDLDEF